MANRLPCAFCGIKTAVHPRRAGEQTQLARLPHAPTKIGFNTFVPLCQLAKQGRAKA